MADMGDGGPSLEARAPQFLAFSTLGNGLTEAILLLGGHLHRVPLTRQLRIVLFCCFVNLTSSGDLGQLFALYSPWTPESLNMLAITR